MPTLILFDCSLSMLTPFPNSLQCSSRKDLATFGVTHFVQEVVRLDKHEQIALASFSDDAELLHDFSRDVNGVTSSLTKLITQSRTSLLSAIQFIDSDGCPNWSEDALSDIVIVSDALGEECDLENEIDSLFPTRLNLRFYFVFINPSNHSCQAVVQSASKLLKKNEQNPDKCLKYLEKGNDLAVQELFSSLAQQIYTPFLCMLRCGSFNSRVQLCPPPTTVPLNDGFTPKSEFNIGSFIDIVGFMKPAELTAPPIVCKHLLLAQNSDSAHTEDEKCTNFCVLLHGSLKVASMLAICRIAPNWYGAVYHMVDSKRSNLILLCFEPGACPISWVGDFSAMNYRDYSQREGSAQFPLPQRPKPSYTLSNASWIEPYGLQADVQKIIRYVKKLPDRQNQFYSEVNKLFRQALAEGFPSLIDKVSELLMKEGTSTTANAETRRHAVYVSEMIRSGSVTYLDGIKPPNKNS